MEPSVHEPDVSCSTAKTQGYVPTDDLRNPDPEHESSVHEPYITSSTPQKLCGFFPDLFPEDIPQEQIPSAILEESFSTQPKLMHFNFSASQTKPIIVSSRQDSSLPRKVYVSSN